jgi:hypothetical protein
MGVLKVVNRAGAEDRDPDPREHGRGVGPVRPNVGRNSLRNGLTAVP